MGNIHNSFDSSSQLRQILVVEDEALNRELLGNNLSSDYRVLYACDGMEALQLAEEHKEDLSLILLDLLMPGMHGLEVLRRLKANPDLGQIPVIVMTAEETAEVESLKLGAVDFITKPYHQPEAILARVQRTIELFEDRQTIASTERDSVTGLYNRDYFYRYTQQFDLYRRDQEMDAIVLDINHFRMINERHGKAYGDLVLRRLGKKVGDLVRSWGGITTRREADTFLAYCPHGVDHQALLDGALSALTETADPRGSRIRLRMGVYPNVDKSLDIERRFDRAKVAADTLRNNYIQSVAYYDSELHRSELYTEQLLEDFQDAIAQGQFKAYYQPKFDIRSLTPVLTSAEALVRWQHPKLGMVSPGSFIPLFENNGLIQELDHYIWRQAAAQIRDWKDRLGISIPVSVNVSRVDIYDPKLVDTFLSLVQEYALEPSELLLEITESVYAQDHTQIIETVNQLRSLGFRVEMDDFGSGYSSLNMISSLPIDALKLDMKFVHSAFNEHRDIRMLELVIDIADYLSVPVVAEGVETGEQLNVLRAMGCEIVQGFYFSRPVPPEEFEPFLLEKRSAVQSSGERPEKELEDESLSFQSIAHALSNGYESIYYVDAATGRYAEFTSQGKYATLGLPRSGSDFFADSLENVQRVVCEEDREVFLQTFDREHLLRELESQHLCNLTYRLMIDGVPTYYNLRAVYTPTREAKNIVIGVSNVDAIVRQSMSYQQTRESMVTFSLIANALAQDYFSIYYVDARTNEYQQYSAKGSYQELSLEKNGQDFFEDTRKNILRVVYGPDQEKALQIWHRDYILSELERSECFSTSYRLMLDGEPVYVSLKAIRASEEDRDHIVVGISSIDAQMKRDAEFAQAREEGLIDALTGVKNNRAYDQVQLALNAQIAEEQVKNFAVVVCDVNDLKGVNEAHGHVVGDQYIKDACAMVCQIFSHSPVFRIGGDTFVAILRSADYHQRFDLMGVLDQRIYVNQVSGKVTMSVGIAEFRTGQDKTLLEVYERANERMHRSKKAYKSHK